MSNQNEGRLAPLAQPTFKRWMEKHGWNDRNAKREFYSHIDILLASEPSLKRAIALIRMPMVEAKRLNTVLDYEVFKRFCTTLLRRESAVLSSTVSKYADITRDPTDPEYEENLIELLDELLAEVAVRWRYTRGVTAPVGLGHSTQDL